MSKNDPDAIIVLVALVGAAAILLFLANSYRRLIRNSPLTGHTPREVANARIAQRIAFVMAITALLCAALLTAYLWPL